jgi:hypothetical protein
MRLQPEEWERLAVCVTVHHYYNGVTNQQDATISVY